VLAHGAVAVLAQDPRSPLRGVVPPGVLKGLCDFEQVGGGGVEDGRGRRGGARTGGRERAETEGGRRVHDGWDGDAGRKGSEGFLKTFFFVGCSKVDVVVVLVDVVVVVVVLVDVVDVVVCFLDAKVAELLLCWFS